MLLLLLALFSGTEAIAQKQLNADSLRRVVATTKVDTARAAALCELALVCRNNGEIDSAASFAEQGLALSRKLKFRRGEAMAVYQLGIISSMRGNYVDALEKLSLAAESYKSIGDKKGYAAALSGMGGQKMMTGDYPGALSYHFQSLRIKEELGDSSLVATTVANIGAVFNASNNVPQALIYFQRSLRLNLEFGKLRNAASDYYNIGNSYSGLKQDSLGMVYAAASARLSDSLGLVENLMYSYSLMARILEKQDKTEALAYYAKALGIARKLDDPRILSFLYFRFGTVYQGLGDAGKAEAYFLKSLELAERINAGENIMNAHNGLSDFYEQRGNFAKALFHHKAYVAARDSLVNEEKQKELVRQEMNFGFEKKQALAQAEAQKQDALEKAAQREKDAVAESDRKRKMIIIYAGSAVLLLVLFFLFLSQRQKSIIATQKVEVERQRDRVEEQKNIIVEKNKSITDSINYAQRIQQAILPDPAMFSKLLPDSFVLYRPKDIVSGDFYWVTEQDGVVYYATADCTGHGVPGGFMSVLGASLLNEVINEKKLAEPAEILDMMRVKIINALRQKGETGENKDGMDMALCRIDLKKRELVYSAANNPVWIISKGELRKFRPDKQPVGIGVENPSPFTQHRVALEPGDIVYTFTDGFADQFGGPKGKKFKYSQLAETLTAISHLPMEQQQSAFGQTFAGWKGELEQVDDVLVIGVKVSGF